MLSDNLNKALIVFFSVAFVSHVVYRLYRKKKAARPEINEVIMFAYGVADLKKSKYSRCMVTKSMDRLLYYLNSPRHNIDICMYVITNMDLLNVILKLHIRGIRIRVILDAEMAFSTGSAIKRLEKQGIQVRWLKSTNLMHHKFCLIDTLAEDSKSNPIVILGSLNWTNQALSGNWEDVVVSSQTDLVKPFEAEFERLWFDFRPIVDIA